MTPLRSAGTAWRRRGVVALIVLAASALAAVAVRAVEPGRIPPLTPSGPFEVTTEEIKVPGPEGRTLKLSLWRPVHASRAGPLVIYSPALGGHRKDGSALAADLASHGYMVAALDDVGNPAALGASAAVTFDFATPASIEKMKREGARHVTLQAMHIRAALDGLTHVNRLAVAFDPARVSLLGYSIGGASSVEAALQDTRFANVVNVDGWLFGEALAGANLPVGRAYLCIQSDEAFPPASDSTSGDPSVRANATLSRDDQILQRALTTRPDGYWLHIKDSFHGDFSDQIYSPSSRTAKERLAIARSLHSAVLTFFNDAPRKAPGQPNMRWLIFNGNPPVRAASAPTQPSAGTK